MPGATVVGLKFVGTISLGLLTGVSYSLSNLTIPSLLGLPSATTAQQTFSRLQARGRTQLSALTTVTTTTLVLAYALSPRRARHPYLLWTALATVLSTGGDLWYSAQRRKAIRQGNLPDESDAFVNGEELRKGMERFKFVQTIRTGVAGLGFLMSVIGIWGDGF
ncbi:MAG: hypothetical protein M1825_001334 [Sarcosagium campestre]|nr:MAG: hypothetical protein M1825_001334 [Sarcosagium campestre]